MHLLQKRWRHSITSIVSVRISKHTGHTRSVFTTCDDTDRPPGTLLRMRGLRLMS